MDTLIDDLTQLINKHLDVVNSVLFGNTENFDLIGNKKWMIYYVNSNEAGFYKILETLDLKTLRFIETHMIGDDNNFYFFKILVNKMLLCGLVKSAVRYTFKKDSNHFQTKEVRFLIRKLIKYNRTINISNDQITGLTKIYMSYRQILLNQNAHNIDTAEDVKIIQDLYHYGDQKLIEYYERFIFSDEKNQFYIDDLHFKDKFIGLVKKGLDVNHLIQRFAEDQSYIKF